MTALPPIDISVVLNAHRESVYIARSLRSLYDTVIHAQARGISCELVIVLDDADAATSDLVRGWDFGYWDSFTLVECCNRSLAESRNAGCRVARGRYICLADADDLWSFNSLSQKVATAQANPKSIVLPHYILAFGVKSFVGRYDAAPNLLLIDQHPYISQICAPAELFQQLQHVHPQKELGYAFEDWHFNCEAASHGWRFVIALDTVLFYRQRHGSIMADIRLQSFCPVQAYSRLFEPAAYLAACAGEMNAAPAGVVSTSETAAKVAETFWGTPEVVSAVLLAAGIDPTIDPGTATRQQPYLAYRGNDGAGRLYYHICKQLEQKSGPRFTDVFLLPDLSIGGGEKYLLQMIEAVEQRADNRVLVVGTSAQARHIWRTRLSSKTTFLPLSDYASFSQAAAMSAVLRLIQASAQGSRIHIKPSEFGHTFVEQHAIHLPECKFIYYRWCDGMNDFMGAKYKNPGSIALLDRMRPRINKIICDCESILRDDEFLLGQKLPNYYILPAYANKPVGIAPAYQNKRRFSGRMVWAGRIDAQKRVELLVMIAALTRKTGLPISIDVYGATEQHAKLRSLFIASPNVSVNPPFAKLGDIDVSRYDGLLYTSWFDGMPNMILEALAHGLPVVAPDVGGIGEVLREGCGKLVPHEFNDERMALNYRSALADFYADFEGAVRMSTIAVELIDRQRSPEVHHNQALQILESSDNERFLQ
ncbi:glycosyltransferase [Aquabacterium sp. A7-Y]|uniref:glycosyltransferase n=1 Tax=Aquabacterium sp. A7-Y TaxID=1349605 RepID=UPI00223CA243|nr:glycosyltransferase [Aquabacterium sp. A7-Y]MCW7536288.1 glycosyltransferase [Aquabacterium sp. A7-Y]